MDNLVAGWAVAQLEALVENKSTAAHGAPFFVAAGIHKPHLPYFFPPESLDGYPPEDHIQIPPPESLAVPKGMPPVAWMTCMGVHGEEDSFVDFESFNLTQPADPQPGPGPAVAPVVLVRNITRGYMASVSYVDSQVGLILSKLETLSLQSDTIVALWGDHGKLRDSFRSSRA
jgi:arylsulfatase A-like enzyme